MPSPADHDGPIAPNPLAAWAELGAGTPTSRWAPALGCMTGGAWVALSGGSPPLAAAGLVIGAVLGLVWLGERSRRRFLEAQHDRLGLWYGFASLRYRSQQLRLRDGVCVVLIPLDPPSEFPQHRKHRLFIVADEGRLSWDLWGDTEADEERERVEAVLELAGLPILPARRPLQGAVSYGREGGRMVFRWPAEGPRVSRRRLAVALGAFGGAIVLQQGILAPSAQPWAAGLLAVLFLLFGSLAWGTRRQHEVVVHNGGWTHRYRPSFGRAREGAAVAEADRVVALHSRVEPAAASLSLHDGTALLESGSLSAPEARWLLAQLREELAAVPSVPRRQSEPEVPLPPAG